MAGHKIYLLCPIPLYKGLLYIKDYANIIYMKKIKTTVTFFIDIEDKRDLFLIAETKQISASHILQDLVTKYIEDSGFRKPKETQEKRITRINEELTEGRRPGETREQQKIRLEK